MRIAILTLPLHTNYGGILQAYALQKALEKMGHSAIVIRKRGYGRFNLFLHPYRLLRRCAKKILYWSTTDFLYEKHFFNTIQRFVDARIKYEYVDNYSQVCKWPIDAIIVGSDQVWRPIYFYGQIQDAFLQFARKMEIKRVSYAASFGTGEWEFTELQTAQCRQLVSIFDYVSVREDSGVVLCDKFLSCKACHVLDPTMLLDASEYKGLIDCPDSFRSSRTLFSYVMDKSNYTTDLTERIEKAFGLLKREADYSIESWLQEIINAEIVITDSFHASVFSILFNKKFVICRNEKRGNARLQSLLKSFTTITEEELLDNDGQIICKVFVPHIDSTPYELNRLRQESLNYLKHALV
ncbi:MAG: polysaccharide pyruvyl transferase family protein [Bacteroidales bacterium]|nr:polysaccharide pyruvyl transferase family protein [Bacteroidales bacterium]